MADANRSVLRRERNGQPLLLKTIQTGGPEADSKRTGDYVWSTLG